MPSLLQKNYGLEFKKSSFLYAAVLFCGMISELLGGVLTDYLLRRTRSLQIARSLLIAVSWTFVVAALVPAILVHDLVIGLAGFTLVAFFLGLAISPLWTAAMDIAPNYAGSSSALMNSAGAVAGIFSPVAFGWILERTGNWTMPFAVSVGLLLFGFSLKTEMVVTILPVLWPVLVNTIGGVTGVHQRLYDVGRTFRLSRKDTILRIILPAAMPPIVVGARISLGLALVLAVVAEMVGNPEGLGYGIVREQQALRPDLMFAYIATVGFIGIALNAGMLALAEVLFPSFRQLRGGQ